MNYMNKLWLALLLACATSLAIVLRNSDAAPAASPAPILGEQVQ